MLMELLAYCVDEMEWPKVAEMLELPSVGGARSGKIIRGGREKKKGTE